MKMTSGQAAAIYQLLTGRALRARVSEFRFAVKHKAEFHSAPTMEAFLYINEIVLEDAA
jgi:hypothetical protein